MIRYLHTLSAIVFYCLGASFFVAYILWHNAIGADAAYMWMNTGDLPLLFSGMLYGGLSVYRSIQRDAAPSHTLMLGIGVPLGILFVLFLFLNFR